VIYFDSAYIAKFYFEEPDSAAVAALAVASGKVHSSVLGKLEVSSVIHRKLRESAIDARARSVIERQFSEDCALGSWLWIPVTPALIDRARAAYARASKKQFMRAADALHLASASEHGFREIHTSDRHVLAAAPLFGLRGVVAV